MGTRSCSEASYAEEFRFCVSSPGEPLTILEQGVVFLGKRLNWSWGMGGGGREPRKEGDGSKWST